MDVKMMCFGHSRSFMGVGFSQGYDSSGTCAFRGKECGVAGVRWGFELREDMTR
jgi:hypothetical protein